MKNNILITIILCLVLGLRAQNQLVNNGAIIKVQNGTQFRVDNAGILNKNAGTINNSGNVYLDADYNQITGATYSGTASSWLWFEGSGTQQMMGDAPISIASLRVDNGDVLNLQQELQVTNNIDLRNNGSIRLNSFQLSALNTNISNYDLNHYIITNGSGTLRYNLVAGDIKEYPLGNSSYNPVILLSNAGPGDVFSVRVADMVLTNGTSGAAISDNIVNRSWHITEDVTGGNDVDIAVEWATAEELATFVRAQSGIAHWDGTQWEHPAAYNAATSAGAGRWTQTRSGQTSFSPFIVEDFDMGLPIELLSFNVKRQDLGQVQLDWATASELNNQGFYIERMLETEDAFETLGFVPGKENATTTSYYQFSDPNGYTGFSYYRLRQMDFDGTISYSDIKVVAGATPTNEIVAVFPNPAHDDISIRFNTDREKVLLKIYSSNGALLQSQTQTVPTDKLLHLHGLSALGEGTYLLSIVMDNGAVVNKRIVLKRN